MAVRLAKISPGQLGKLEADLAKKLPKIVEQLHRDVGKKAVEILQAETLKIKPYPPVFSGKSFRGWIVKREPRLGVTITNKQDYFRYVEGGRRAGARMPPPDALVPWVKKRFGVTGKAAKRAAYGLAVAISRRGIKPKPVAQNAVPRILKVYKKELEKAARKWLQRR